MEDFIRTYTVNKKLCDGLIKYHKLNKEYKAEGETSRGVIKDYKDSIDVRFYNQSIDKTILDFFKILSVCAKKYLDEFKIEFNIITDTVNLIQYYPKNGGYKVFHSENASLPSAHRRLVYMLYLNNVPDGGTEFKYQNIITPAVKGNLIIWPADFTHTHKGVISKTKEKYIATGWFKNGAARLLMIESTVNGIFQTPIYFSKLNRKLTKKELSFIKKTASNSYKNEGNTTSNNTYILNQKVFKNLKTELDLIIQDYFNKVICSADNITPFITQSWLNYTETNQYHHKHAHPNSLVSGVFYINCDKQFDKIKFYNETYKTIKPAIKKWNLWNSESWWFSIKTGDIIMFPSSLTHSVETKKGNNTRISLAFNVFIKGTFGNNKELVELKI